MLRRQTKEQLPLWSSEILLVFSDAWSQCDSVRNEFANVAQRFTHLGRPARFTSSDCVPSIDRIDTSFATLLFTAASNGVGPITRQFEQSLLVDRGVTGVLRTVLVMPVSDRGRASLLGVHNVLLFLFIPIAMNIGRLTLSFLPRHTADSRQ